MSDRYAEFTRSGFGRLLVKQLGLPDPVRLDRYTAGDPLVRGVVGVGGSGRFVESLPGLLERLGIEAVPHPDLAEGTRFKGLVLDATGLTDPGRLVALRDFFTPLMRRLEPCARLVVLGTPPELTSGSERVAQRALEGFTRSLGKEAGRGTTVQLVYVADGAEAATLSTLGFLLSPKSAYVSGQVVRIGTRSTSAPEADVERPLAGKVALVTGASRGIGEQIARVLHRDGATVVGVDVPQVASDLQVLMKELGGDWLTLDISGPDAPQRIAQHLRTEHGGVDVVVHNAGITRDKKLANMDEARWQSVIDVNLVAPERITRELLDQGLVRPQGRIVGVASTSGIGGLVGQTNYATSKAGVIGFVDALADELEDDITINAVAPGFIETKMTAAVPFATREVGRRLNSMSQGGQPVDVAETVAWFASPGSAAVSGNVVRVCGQMMLGA